jgi:hypothetical protein
MSGGILGPFAVMIDRNEADLSTDELLRRAAPTERARLVLLDVLETRWLAHYSRPYFDTEH